MFPRKHGYQCTPARWMPHGTRTCSSSPRSTCAAPRSSSSSSRARRPPHCAASSPARTQGTPVYTACSGTFLLAESGVLGGRRATTTWWLTPAFRARYPEVDLDQTRMVVSSDGVTTAGAAFGHVDLALAVVRASSPTLADLISSYLVVDERSSQSAYTIPSALAQSDPSVAAFERWVRDRLAEPVSILEAARAMGMSERTLQRLTVRLPAGVCSTCPATAPAGTRCPWSSAGCS